MPSVALTMQEKYMLKKENGQYAIGLFPN